MNDERARKGRGGSALEREEGSEREKREERRHI